MTRTPSRRPTNRSAINWPDECSTLFDELLNTQQKLNHTFLQGLTDKARFVEGWEYNRMYDVANPVAVSTGNNITAGGVPSNRVTDSTGAVAGGAINSATAQSTLNNVTAQLGELSTMVDGLAQATYTANTAIAETQGTILEQLGQLIQNGKQAAPATK